MVKSTELLEQTESIAEGFGKAASWRTNPFVLVSLFEMLRISAEQLHAYSSTLMKYIVAPQTIVHEGQELADYLNAIMQTCHDLGLRLSLNQCSRAIHTLHTGCLPEQMRGILQELHRRMFEELSAQLFLYVPEYKQSFHDPQYWENDLLRDKFPSTIEEFQRAGRCYAYGESTACVFHLMRIVDAGLKAAAKSLDIAYDANSWNTIAKFIQGKMEEKYQLKTDGWKGQEPFYAGILTDIQAISKAHRNDCLHRLDRLYDEQEARHLITVVHGFIRHLAEGGLHE